MTPEKEVVIALAVVPSLKGVFARVLLIPILHAGWELCVKYVNK